MLHLKNLLLAVENTQLNLPESEAKVTLDKAILEAREFLCSTKTFEYDGKFNMKFGNVIKLEGINTDLDDVVRAITGKHNGIEFSGYLCLVVLPPAEVVAKPVAKPDGTSETILTGLC
jgi:hypothetical protein